MKQLNFRSTDFSRCFDLKKLEISRLSDSIEHTHIAIFNIYKKISFIYPKSAAIGFFSKGLKEEFETAVVNKPSEFEPLKFYCIFLFTVSY